MGRVFVNVLVFFCIVFVALLLGCNSAIAAQTFLLTESYDFSDNLSPNEGCEQAIARLKKRATEDACGSHASGSSMRVLSEEVDDLSLFYFEILGGRVIGFNLKKRSYEQIFTDKKTGQSLWRCTIHAETSINCDRGKRDPSFAPTLSSDVQINRVYFQEGEGMVLQIHARNVMYITVLQLLPYLKEETNVWRIFPNQFQTDPMVRPGKDLFIPDSQEGHKYELLLQLPSGKEPAYEKLLVIATRKLIKFPERMTAETFHSILSEIPLDDRREHMIPYAVTKKRTR